MKFVSSHKLKFQVAPQFIARTPTGKDKFKCGTCRGVLAFQNLSIDIESVVNDSPGNGHLDDVFEWLFEIARLRGVSLRILDIRFEEFRQQLIQKWGFKETDIESQLVRFDFVKPKKPAGNGKVKTSSKR